MTLKNSSILILLILGFCFNQNSFALTYYVKSDGDDKKSGLSDEAAWRTIQRVNSHSYSDGDSVLFKSGHIFQDATIKSPGVDKFTFGSYEVGEKPIINGDIIRPIYIADTIKNITIQNLDISGQDWNQSKISRSSNLYIKGVDGVTLDGIIGNGFKGGSTSPLGNTAIILTKCIGRQEVKNCNIYNWGPPNLPSPGKDNLGIAIDQPIDGSTILIHNNIVHDVNADCLHLYKLRNDTIAKVYKNEIYNGGEEGIDIKLSSNCEIYENDIYRTTSYGQGGSGSVSPTVGILGKDGIIARNNIIRDNFIHNSNTVGVFLTTGKDTGHENTKIYNNVISDCKAPISITKKSKGTKIFNNIIINPLPAVIFDMERAAITISSNETGTEIYNNTIYADSGNIRQLISLNGEGGALIRDNVLYNINNNSESWCIDWSGKGLAPIIEFNCSYNKSNTNRIKYGSNFKVYEDDLEIWIGMGHTGEVFSNPLFKDEESRDFRFRESSPCIIGDRILGAVSSVMFPPKYLKIKIPVH